MAQTYTFMFLLGLSCRDVQKAKWFSFWREASLQPGIALPLEGLPGRISTVDDALQQSLSCSSHACMSTAGFCLKA